MEGCKEGRQLLSGRGGGRGANSDEGVTSMGFFQYYYYGTNDKRKHFEGGCRRFRICYETLEHGAASDHLLRVPALRRPRALPGAGIRNILSTSSFGLWIRNTYLSKEIIGERYA
jgi:hypothetical protein